MKVLQLLPAQRNIRAGLKTAIVGLLRELDRDSFFQLTEDVFSADIAHMHGMWRIGNSIKLLVLALRRKPYVISPHGMLEPWALRHKRFRKFFFLYLIEIHALKYAAAIHAASDLEARSVRRIVKHPNIVVIPFGVDSPCAFDRSECRNSVNATSDEFVIVFLSRIDRKKGLELLFDALRHCSFQSAVRLEIIGDGDSSYIAELKGISSKLTPPLKVIWRGPVYSEEKWRFLLAADLFVLLSHSENFGFAAGEALAVGTQILVSEEMPWNEFDLPGVHVSALSTKRIVAHLNKIVASGHQSADRRNEISTATMKRLRWDEFTRNLAAVYRSV